MNLKRFERKAPEAVSDDAPQIINGVSGVAADGGITRIALSGKIDVNNFEDVQEQAFAAIEDTEEEFVFDMSDVSYVSSAGLRMFSAVNSKTTEKGISYKLTRMREDILKLFQMTGYASAFRIDVKED